MSQNEDEDMEIELEDPGVETEASIKDAMRRTTVLRPPSNAPKLRLQGFAFEIIEGPLAPKTWQATTSRCTIGAHPSNDLVLEDDTVSGFHCEVVVDASGVQLHDTQSRNGTFVDGLKIADVWLHDGCIVHVGRSVMRFRLLSEDVSVSLSNKERFSGIVGRSTVMREVFAILERCAVTSSTVLIEGETGTGKEAVAMAIHESSSRGGGPFVVVDCSSIPANLVESELFGHERGAFTGAVATRLGAFEQANRGTIFLDELGELPSEMQPKLLRVLEQRTIQKIGGNKRIPIDVRVVAATNRTLRSEVNSGQFRSDLFYRLAVINLRLPPLRERRDDIPLLVSEFLDQMRASQEDRDRIMSPEFLRRMQSAEWQGNVRELRNYVERVLVLGGDVPIDIVGGAVSRTPMGIFSFDPEVGYAEARTHAIADFERSYLKQLLDHNQGNVSKAARAAGVDRVYLHRLLRRHGIRSDESKAGMEVDP